MLNESQEILQHTQILYNFILLLTKSYKGPKKGKHEINFKMAAVTVTQLTVWKGCPV